MHTRKAANWNQIIPFISIQLTSLYQFSACESTIVIVIVDSDELNWNRTVN